MASTEERTAATTAMLREAKGRWGKQGAIQACYPEDHPPVYMVGTALGFAFCAKGFGRNWSDAFSHAAHVEERVMREVNNACAKHIGRMNDHALRRELAAATERILKRVNTEEFAPIMSLGVL